MPWISDVKLLKDLVIDAGNSTSTVFENSFAVSKQLIYPYWTSSCTFG